MKKAEISVIYTYLNKYRKTAMTARYNEKTRVQIPTVAHLGRLGYQYLSLKTAQWDVAITFLVRFLSRRLQKLTQN